MHQLNHTEFREVGTAKKSWSCNRRCTLCTYQRSYCHLDDHMSMEHDRQPSPVALALGLGVGTAIEIEKIFDFQKNLVALV